MEQEKYVFIKDYETQEGTIKKGTEIIRFRGFVYMNGGMLLPAYAKIINNIVDNKNLNKEFLSKEIIIRNKL
jgi:hypothetical protein